MPYSIRKTSKPGYDIINKNTGKVVGHSATKTNARKSINARNAGEHGSKGKK